MSGFDETTRPKHSLAFGAADRGQSYPQHCPRSPNEDVTAGDLLGEPLSIRAVALIIGCSAWTVRQKYVPAGLPHLRSGPNGKLIFYKNQVIRWLLEKQRKGGTRT